MKGHRLPIVCGRFFASLVKRLDAFGAALQRGKSRHAAAGPGGSSTQLQRPSRARSSRRSEAASAARSPGAAGAGGGDSRKIEPPAAPSASNSKRRTEPKQIGAPAVMRRAQQHEVAVARDQEVEHLLVAVAGRRGARAPGGAGPGPASALEVSIDSFWQTTQRISCRQRPGPRLQRPGRPAPRRAAPPATAGASRRPQSRAASARTSRGRVIGTAPRPEAGSCAPGRSPAAARCAGSGCWPVRSMTKVSGTPETPKSMPVRPASSAPTRS